MKNQKFEVGQTVFLKSDVQGLHAMVILEVLEHEYDAGNGDGCRVCWITKGGRMMYDQFPAIILREARGM